MKDILRRCKCGVFFTSNEHKNYYEKVEDWLVEQMEEQSDIDEVGKEVWDEMIKRDNVLVLQFYTHTPVGFYKIFHYDYDELIKQANNILDEINQQG